MTQKLVAGCGFVFFPWRFGVPMRLILSCAFFLSATITAASADAVISYTLSPVMGPKGLTALLVEVRFDGEDDGDTVLVLPNEWGGKSKLYEGIRDLKIAGGDVVAQGDPARRIVHHRPRAKLYVSYRVVQNWPGEPQAGSGGNEYRPIIQPGYFQVLGNAVFVTPERDDEPAASFALKNLPNGWNFASDLENAGQGRALSLGDIVESVMVGGDFRVLARGPVRLAIRGKWPFSDEAFIGRLQPIISSHRIFWGDAAEPYLVTALPLKHDAASTSLGGTGRGDAFAFFATDNAEQDLLTGVLAHEHLHSWIPRRIGSMPTQETEPADYWLSEGFTDFYTSRLLLRDGIWTVKRFTDVLNELLKDYAASPVRTAPNSKIVKDFWTDGATEKLPYQRGQLLALLWDFRLRALSDGAHDLDEVMLAMKARVSASTEKPALATVLFAEEMKKAGVDIAADLAHLVRDGEAFSLPEDIFAPCGEVGTVDIPGFDRGFDADKTAQNGGVIVGLRADTPAYRAGLRNGMKIVKREAGKPGDSRVMLSYRVLDGGVEKLVSFLPEGENRVVFQEFVPDAEADKMACATRLSGLPGVDDAGFWSGVRKWFSPGRP